MKKRRTTNESFKKPGSNFKVFSKSYDITNRDKGQEGNSKGFQKKKKSSYNLSFKGYGGQRNQSSSRKDSGRQKNKLLISPGIRKPSRKGKKTTNKVFLSHRDYLSKRVNGKETPTDSEKAKQIEGTASTSKLQFFKRKDSYKEKKTGDKKGGGLSSLVTQVPNGKFKTHPDSLDLTSFKGI